jgi:hypothetical protein
MAPQGRFGSGVVFAVLSPLFPWGFAQCETKRVVSGLSLGKRRASPPSIRFQPEGTRTINGLEVFLSIDRLPFSPEKLSPSILPSTPVRPLVDAPLDSGLDSESTEEATTLNHCPELRCHGRTSPNMFGFYAQVSLLSRLPVSR